MYMYHVFKPFIELEQTTVGESSADFPKQSQNWPSGTDFASQNQWPRSIEPIHLIRTTWQTDTFADSGV